MAGAFSGHLIDSQHPDSPFNSSIVTNGAMSFNPMMHGTPFAQKPFSHFNPQSSFANDSISEETAKRIATLQVKLDQKLGPEYISQRPGPGGGPKLTYVEGWKIINLANEVFGFNGWSSSIVSLNTDFTDYSEETRRYCVGVTAIMRVTLRDGVYHEDIGYGMLENSKSKGAALDKCKKEAVTDGLKRALRGFGNVLGNCLYDKTYTAEIVKVKFEPVKFKKDELHRRPEFEDIKPNISTPSTSTSAGPSNYNMAKPPYPNPNATVTPTRPPMQHNRGNSLTSLPPHMRSEVQASSMSSSSSNSSPNTSIIQPSIATEKGSTHSHQQPTGLNTPITTPLHKPPPQRANIAQPQKLKQLDSRVAFSESSISMPPPALPVKPEPDRHMDEFGFNSDDDAFLALVDLGPPIGADDVDAGRPIEADMDTGRPIDQEEGLLQSAEEDNEAQTATDVGRPTMHGPNAVKSRHELIAAALRGEVDDTTLPGEAQSKPIASGSGPVTEMPSKHPSHQPHPNISATSNSSSFSSSSIHPHPPHNQSSTTTTSFPQQRHQQYMNQRQNQNQNPNQKPAQHQPSSTTSVQRVPAQSMGGFHFPPGANPIQSGSSTGVGTTTSSIGLKRPAEAMGSSSFRGGRPGMGLQQAMAGVPVNGRREVLGSLDIGEGGDVKRRRW